MLVELQKLVQEAFERNVASLVSSPCNTTTQSCANFRIASLYPLSNPGKLIRPTLCFAAASAVGCDTYVKLEIPAFSIELIHCYSLIHDDLPSMDDDDLRRGAPALHKAFDEATAILVGDTLLTRAFELISNAPALSDSQRLAVIRTLSKAAGAEGMVGGQFMDIQSTGVPLTELELEHMHKLKTGALICASVEIGGIVAEASSAKLRSLKAYGENIGLAFQIADDILDVQGSALTLGKTPNKDSIANKPTFVSILGLENAKHRAKELVDTAKISVKELGESAAQLNAIADYIIERTH